MPSLSWPTALVVVAALAALTVLSLNRVDTSDVALILITLLGGAGVDQLRRIRRDIKNPPPPES